MCTRHIFTIQLERKYVYEVKFIGLAVTDTFAHTFSLKLMEKYVETFGTVYVKKSIY